MSQFVLIPISVVLSPSKLAFCARAFYFCFVTGEAFNHTKFHTQSEALQPTHSSLWSTYTGWAWGFSSCVRLELQVLLNVWESSRLRSTTFIEKRLQASPLYHFPILKSTIWGNKCTSWDTCKLPQAVSDWKNGTGKKAEAPYLWVLWSWSRSSSTHMKLRSCSGEKREGLTDTRWEPQDQSVYSIMCE